MSDGPSRLTDRLFGGAEVIGLRRGAKIAPNKPAR